MKKHLMIVLLSSCLSTLLYAEVCDNQGMAGIYPCQNIDLMSHLSLSEMGGSNSESGADIWGWTDAQTGKEYAIMTMRSGTAFVDISAPDSPVYLGKLVAATTANLWRDVKTYANYAFIVSEASGHGMQVFDLTQLRNVISPPVIFTATTNYTQFGEAHNIVINEESGFAYAVGTNTCNGGLHMINIQNPASPTNAGCFASDGTTHDAQCVNYLGADVEYSGKEICFNANGDTLTIVNVSDKNNPQQLSRTGYANSRYAHQGWLSEDQNFYLMGDELDEDAYGHNTKTYIWNVKNLDSPQLLGEYIGSKASIDHNIYIKANLAYLTNYTSGLSIVDISDIANGNLYDKANFDSYPSNDGATFDGAWSNYPFFQSGTVILSDYDSGLFVLKPNLDTIFLSGFE